MISGFYDDNLRYLIIVVTQLTIQEKFLELAKQKLNPGISIAEKIALLLNMSKDSAYRRLRGEISLSFDEIGIISRDFNISLDNLLLTDNKYVTFSYRVIDHEILNFEHYLESILDNMELSNVSENTELIYAAKDMPIFHEFCFSELASFKIFFWLKTILQDPNYKDKSFDFNAVPEKLITLGKRIWEKYMVLPSLELWNEGTINVTLKQMEYYFESGIMDKAQTLKLCDVYTKLVEHIQSEAEAGRKFNDVNDGGSKNNFKIYYNEVSIPNNTLLLVMGDIKIAYVECNMLDILTTTNKYFCDQSQKYLNNIIRKSSLISVVSEKERIKLFRIMKSRISVLKERVENAIENDFRSIDRY